MWFVNYSLRNLRLPCRFTYNAVGNTHTHILGRGMRPIKCWFSETGKMFCNICWSDLFKNNRRKAASECMQCFCRAKQYAATARLLQRRSSFTLLIIFWKWKVEEGERRKAYSPQCEPPNFPLIYLWPEDSVFPLIILVGKKKINHSLPREPYISLKLTSGAAQN